MQGETDVLLSPDEQLRQHDCEFLVKCKIIFKYLLEKGTCYKYNMRSQFVKAKHVGSLEREGACLLYTNNNNQRRLVKPVNQVKVTEQVCRGEAMLRKMLGSHC